MPCLRLVEGIKGLVLRADKKDWLFITACEGHAMIHRTQKLSANTEKVPQAVLCIRFKIAHYTTIPKYKPK